MWDVYNHVADVLLKMEQRRGSMKSLVFNLHDVSLPAKKNIFALACRTLERTYPALLVGKCTHLLNILMIGKSVIDRVLESTSLLEKEPKVRTRP